MMGAFLTLGLIFVLVAALTALVLTIVGVIRGRSRGKMTTAVLLVVDGIIPSWVLLSILWQEYSWRGDSGALEISEDEKEEQALGEEE